MTPHEFAWRHAPLFHFHPGEAALCCFPADAEEDFVKVKAHTFHGERSPKMLASAAPCYWEHFAEGDSHLPVIRFWLWYRFNDYPLGSFGDHAGDWEWTAVCLGPDGSAVRYLYSAHSSSQTRVAEPAKARFDAAGRWQVWVAQGSHANFEAPDVVSLFPPDFVAAGGPVLDARNGLRPVTATNFFSEHFTEDWAPPGVGTGPGARPLSEVAAFLA